MRSGITRSLYQAPEGFWTFAYFRVTNYDGTWVNLGALAVGDRVLRFGNTMTWSDDIDRNALTMSATFTREIGPYSLVPFRTDSPVNVDDGGAYQPALDLSRQWEIMGCFLPIGSFPVDEGDFRQMAAGICTRIDVQTEPATITVQGNGKEADLIDRRILFVDNTADPPVSITSDTPKTYAGGALATVLQTILDDELGVGVVTLTVDASAPAFFVNGWDQTSDIGLFDLLQQVAGLAGANVRYRYDASDVLSLTLFAPDRNATSPAWSIGGDEYEKLAAGVDRRGIRNYVVVRYLDEFYGAQTVTSPVEVPPVSASISRYGLRPLAIDLAATTQVTGQTEAGNLADAIRSDLEFPVMEQQIQGVGLWFADLGDYVQLIANGIHYDEDQYGGITGYSHTFANGELTSTISLRGQPAGRYRTWLDFGPGKPRTPFTPTVLNVSADYAEVGTVPFRFPAVLWSAQVNQYVRSVMVELLSEDTLTVISTFYYDVDPATLSLGSAFLTGVARDTIYWVRVTPYSGPLSGGLPTGVQGAWMQDSTFVQLQAPTQAELDEVIDAIDETSGSVGEIGIPLVFISHDTVGVEALTTIPTAAAEIAGFRRKRYLVGAGSARLRAIVENVTGTPSLGVEASADNFATAGVTVLTLPIPGDGTHDTDWVEMPAGTAIDGFFRPVALDGADTDAVDVRFFAMEVRPALVTALRDFSDDFSDDFS